MVFILNIVVVKYVFMISSGGSSNLKQDFSVYTFFRFLSVRSKKREVIMLWKIHLTVIVKIRTRFGLETLTLQANCLSRSKFILASLLRKLIKSEACGSKPMDRLSSSNLVAVDPCSGTDGENFEVILFCSVYVMC